MLLVSCESPLTNTGKEIKSQHVFAPCVVAFRRRFDRLLLLLVEGTEDIFLYQSDELQPPHFSEGTVLKSPGFRWTHACQCVLVTDSCGAVYL